MKLIKNRKKKGFTLIEMVAVVAIIGILAAILVPKVTGYMNEAKKTGVIDQARKLTQAYETAKMKGKAGAIVDGTTITNLSTSGQTGNDNLTMASLLDVVDSTGKLIDGTKLKALLDKLPEGTTMKNCKDIVDGAEFKMDSTGKILDTTSIVTK
ncbi:MAG: type II secretion system protein [Clostridium sp.]|uniref:type II secretion system protein n=1 Tax=Clostridium sp. TaxID=1506 RepID=UPI003EE53F3A